MRVRGPAPVLAASSWPEVAQSFGIKQPRQVGGGTQPVGPDPNSLYSEVTPGPCPGAWKGAKGRPGFCSLQRLSFSVPRSKLQSGCGHIDFTAEPTGFSTVGDVQTYPSWPRVTRAPHSHSGGRGPLPDTHGPPLLYLVRECLPMRTRRSFSVKFLSQGGYRRQWAAVRIQRSLMRLAPHSSSWGLFRKSITCLGEEVGSIGRWEGCPSTSPTSAKSQV